MAHVLLGSSWRSLLFAGVCLLAAAGSCGGSSGTTSDAEAGASGAAGSSGESGQAGNDEQAGNDNASGEPSSAGTNAGAGASGSTIECLADADCDERQQCLEHTCRDIVTCVNSLDCVDVPDDRLICDRNLQRCVVCTDGADCDENYDCINNTCIAFNPCSNSLDCPADQVCDRDLGRCYQCVEDADCDTGICAGHSCRMACASDKDCTPHGLLCDSDRGYCVQCVEDSDCAETQFCDLGTCAPDICRANEVSCNGDAVAECNAAGSAWLELGRCASNQSCIVTDGDAVCVDDVIEGNGGSGGEGGASGNAGSAGGGTAGTAAGSNSGICNAGDTRECLGSDGCAGEQSCESDGLGWSTCVCSEGTGGAGGTSAGACTADSVRSCTGYADCPGVQTCNAEGTGWSVCDCSLDCPSSNVCMLPIEGDHADSAWNPWSINGKFNAYASGTSTLTWDPDTRCASGTVYSGTVTSTNWGMGVYLNLNQWDDTIFRYNAATLGVEGVIWEISGTAPGLQVWIEQAGTWDPALGCPSDSDCTNDLPPWGRPLPALGYSLVSATQANYIIFSTLQMSYDNWGTSYVYPPPWNANDIITVFFKIPKSASVTRNYDFCVDAIAIQF